ncbi:SHOCT domain-containing protein [Microaerobacter geothermalis]|uniref:SHOCT domain-containing protein n=1 Tax=Microaerobacter geothermalis TaxID=674972 RepID=UPI001F45CDAD|nr:SHOCT domain-containing protein [Microaerobacter geothermalis]MCF6094994.1 SHOCT domain-containing protein [Microaerobacter geothermalis]
MMGFGGMGFGYGLFNMIFWILILVGIVYLVIYLVKGNDSKGGGNEALQVLDRRYANGEISEDEYKRMKENLKK